MAEFNGSISMATDCTCGTSNMGIYQLFYKEKSSVDRGSLYQLRNLINRRNVSGPEEVISSYRAHHDFIADITDSYIVAAFLDIMQMEDLNSTPKPIPLFSLMSDNQKNDWLIDAAEKVITDLKINKVSFQHIVDDIAALDGDTNNLNAMKTDEIYLCAVCGKQYYRRGWLKKHLEKKHHWEFHVPQGSSEENNPIQTFMFMSLLYRDTYDSYRMGDGDRIIRNVYFEWLYAAGIRHSKYKIWLFRILCNMCLLSPEQSFEYKWNMTVNLQGGIGQSIPNDNCVEIQVHNIKSQLNTQGSNKSFKTAKQICMTTQVIDAIKDGLMSTTKTARSKSSRPVADKTKDIMTVVNFLRSQGFVKDITWSSFSKFKDPIRCIEAIDLHEWMIEQKEIAKVYMK
ncbi:uncharacterized protein LOC134283658 [Saccostrea cucullata]|uniref:uncharacterized protein LOC134283658 n=1 Tax=Saccostrea cuccullata TaxID=36930 RepID=UPI002ED52611